VQAGARQAAAARAVAAEEAHSPLTGAFARQGVAAAVLPDVPGRLELAGLQQEARGARMQAGPTSRLCR
jgi:hypothetical protein